MVLQAAFVPARCRLTRLLCCINFDGVVKSPIYYALDMNLFTSPSIVEFMTFYEIINL